MNYPRGIKNNNPGNIRKGDDWQGMSDEQEDPSFITFDSAEYGLRALMKLLFNYFTKYRLDTVRAIINRWAPPIENDTGAYQLQVAKHLGVGIDTILFPDKKTIIDLAKAITLHENGKPEWQKNNIAPPFWYPENVYDRAYELLKGEKHEVS